MALCAIKQRSELAPVFVLAPERYDPRRTIKSAEDGTPLGSVVQIVRDVIQPANARGDLVVLDTSNARDGVITTFLPQQGNGFASAKKLTKPGDVIISRLRPYLRQVAYVDDAVFPSHATAIACSTEFFVLRPRDGTSIAFLIPFLLTRRVQQVLAAAQEGGHHPRVNESTLLSIPIPSSILNRRQEISHIVTHSISLYREAERGIGSAIVGADEAFSTSA